MTSKSSSILKAYESDFSEFVITKIADAGGFMNINNLLGHLSQLKSDVRNAVGSSKSNVLQFLKRHKNVFIIEDNVVRLVDSSTFSTSGYDSDNGSIKSHSNLPPKIKNGKGVIVKIFPGYGFIKSKEPIKTDIFFKSVCFGDRDIDLTSFLHVGAVVFFHAKRESSNFSCKYQALKVWRIDKGDKDNVIIQKTPRTRETGLYDPPNLESEGIIQNIFSNLGFISVKGDNNNTVFFHKNRVAKYDNIVDLTKVFTKGDKVEFTAHRSSKPDAKARWEATKVWKVAGKIEQDESQSVSCNQISLPKQPISDSKAKSHEMIKNQSGKLYPRSHGAVIKFGNNELADGDSALYYVCNTQVTEIGWEFTEGDSIYFDAVKIKSSPGWKAVLVWTDKKPNIVLPTCLGDFSEFTEEEEISSSIYTSKSSLCMSESSNSSVNFPKKISSKTEKLSNKKLSKNCNTSSRESLSSLPISDKYCFVGKENNDSNKKLSKNCNTSSRDSLNSLPVSDKCPLRNSEKVIKSSPNISFNELNKTLSNWGDSPFPDEAYESMEGPKSVKSDFSLKYDREIEHSAENEIENSSEYASAEEEKLAEFENRKFSTNNVNLKCAASLKRYYDIKGEIKRVYCKFAEIKSCSLQNDVPFSLPDFSLNGEFTDELEVNDLKRILKVGDSVRFNCFVIIDDKGKTWQKVTLAWKGSKPKYSNEISPEDFIKQNNLSVTITNETTDKAEHRKFLSSFVDEISDNMDNSSKTESCSDEESLTSSPKSQAHSKIELPVDFENLSDSVYKILKRDIFSNDLVVDIRSVSEEIINTIIQNCTKKTNTLTYNVLSEASKSLENICSKCKEESSDLNTNSSKMNNTGTQTIITGDIISQNILTDC